MDRTQVLLTVCVVDTGIPKYVAISIIIEAVIRLVNIPSITISGSSSYSSALNILPRTVLVTLAPRSNAPLNSQIVAMITACFSVKLLDATDVATA